MKILNIITCWEKQPDRIDRIKKYWGKDQNLLFLSNISNDSLGIIGFDTPDGIENLIYSSIELFKNFDSYIDYDWFILNDSDSYLFMNKIKNFLFRYNFNESIWIGRGGMKDNKVFSDGSCIILSNASMRKLVKYIKETPKLHVDDEADVNMGVWFTNCGLTLIDRNDLIQHGSPFQEGYSSNVLSYHYCFEKEYSFLFNKTKFIQQNIPIDYVKGENFIGLADNVNIFYRHTHEVNNFLRTPPKNNFVLITHNSDAMVIDEPKWYTERDCWNADTTLIPDNLVRWFGQNIGVRHSKIESLPIGLENTYNFPHDKKIEKISKITKNPKQNINLMYMNYNVNNNISERLPTISLFKDKPWVTTFMGSNGYNFDNYLYNIYNHKFVISPIGGGFESHRLWESLYIGTIPVVKRNINYSFYDDLPICFVDDWSEITEQFLLSEYDRIMESSWNLEKLSMNYWIEKIKLKK